jgi:hypothetical protein
METMTSSPMTMASTPFMGPEVKSGCVIAKRDLNGLTLSWSDDFMVPGAPAPHWQVVDAAGNAYLLQRLEVVNGRQNRTVTVPAYVRQVSSVRVYCAFAEVVLGEATFSSPVM